MNDTTANTPEQNRQNDQNMVINAQLVELLVDVYVRLDRARGNDYDDAYHMIRQYSHHISNFDELRQAAYEQLNEISEPGHSGYDEDEEIVIDYETITNGAEYDDDDNLIEPIDP